MAFPTDPLAAQFATVPRPDTSQMDARTTDQLNALRAAVSLGVDGNGNSSTNVTLANVAQQYATDQAETVVLPYACSKLVVVNARFRMGTGATSGAYSVQAGYNTGSSAAPGSATLGGIASNVELSDVGVNGQRSGLAVAVFNLAAGTYTFYGVVVRVANGTNTDVCAAGQVLVFDVGGR